MLLIGTQLPVGVFLQILRVMLITGEGEKRIYFSKIPTDQATLDCFLRTFKIPVKRYQMPADCLYHITAFPNCG